LLSLVSSPIAPGKHAAAPTAAGPWLPSPPLQLVPLVVVLVLVLVPVLVPVLVSVLVLVLLLALLPWPPPAPLSPPPRLPPLLSPPQPLPLWLPPVAEVGDAAGGACAERGEGVVTAGAGAIRWPRGGS
jgi:hypothetical protein